MTEAINAHKKMAMGMTEGNVMKKGGAVSKYASGGMIKTASMKKGGPAKGGLTIVIATPMKKSVGRGR